MTEEMAEDQISQQTEEEGAQPGFLLKWVAPALFVVILIVALMALTRVSLPVLGPDSEVPDEHFSGGCATCHRVQPGFDWHDLAP
ncbi:MAG: hypothetical protein Kow0056_12910 [Coriobacteriia bacterium]